LNQVISIERLSKVLNQYDLFIIDQWGVLHNGIMGYHHAIDCIKNLTKSQKKLIIVSNSSKRKHSTINRLPKLGFDKEDFAEVLTSGEMIWQNLYSKSNDFFKKLGSKCYHLTDETKEDGLGFVNGLEYDFVEKIEDANFILGCTTSPDFTTLDYVPLLEKAIKKNIPFICANPDYETVESLKGNLIICMGTVAELYKDFGGSVFIMGKPSIEIYKEATKDFKKTDKKRMLAIGDSIHHDIKGAMNFGIDSLLITSGIHKSIFNQSHLVWEDSNNYLTEFKIKPTYLCSKFQF
tara:strand:- start:16 stop:894 length:879 start_codon:yes stop_codon:yes gene_type:complete